MWKSTSELRYRVDGVGRSKFDFHTGLAATLPDPRAAPAKWFEKGVAQLVPDALRRGYVVHEIPEGDRCAVRLGDARAPVFASGWRLSKSEETVGRSLIYIKILD